MVPSLLTSYFCITPDMLSICSLMGFLLRCNEVVMVTSLDGLPSRGMIKQLLLPSWTTTPPDQSPSKQSSPIIKIHHLNKTLFDRTIITHAFLGHTHLWQFPQIVLIDGHKESINLHQKIFLEVKEPLRQVPRYKIFLELLYVFISKYTFTITVLFI